MNKNTFFEELKNTLELTSEVTEITELHLSSLETLTVIAFVDENFDMQIKAADLKNIKSVNDLMVLIGNDKIQ